MIWIAQLMWIAKNYLVITVCQELFLLLSLNPFNKHKTDVVLPHFTSEITEAQRIK